MSVGPEFLATRPSVAATAWIAPGATVVGEVAVEDGASVWYGCVIRGDLAPIRIGAQANVQDLTVVHVDRGMPSNIGNRVTIGHRCVIHGCTIGDGATIGMGSVLLSGSRIGKGALVVAGSVVREGFVVPDGAIAAGVPAILRGEVTEALRTRFDAGVESYLELARAYRGGER